MALNTGGYGDAAEVPGMPSLPPGAEGFLDMMLEGMLNERMSYHMHLLAVALADYARNKGLDPDAFIEEIKEYANKAYAEHDCSVDTQTVDSTAVVTATTF